MSQLPSLHQGKYVGGKVGRYHKIYRASMMSIEMPLSMHPSALIKACSSVDLGLISIFGAVRELGDCTYLPISPIYLDMVPSTRDSDKACIWSRL